MLLHQLFADRLQFQAALLRGLGIRHLESLERIEDNSGNNQPGVLFIISGNNIPGRVMGAGRVQAILKGLSVAFPIFPLVNVREAEFPVLIRLINAFEEAPSLFVLRQMEEELDDTGAITMEMLLQVHDRTIPFLPNGFLVAQLFRKAFVAENLGMHPNDENFLIVGTIEDGDPPAFGKPVRGAPEEIMFQFLGAWLFETENVAALRIDPGHDVADGAVLAGGVYPLKNQQQRIAVGRVVKLLHCAQLCNVFFQDVLILLLRLAKGLHDRRPRSEVDLFPWRDTEIL